MKNATVNLYYKLRPAIPRWAQVVLRQVLIRIKRCSVGAIWPIDKQAVQQPRHWGGWPDGKRFALVLTHDVETDRGQQRCTRLADMEKRMGFRSSFNFVPERYPVSAHLRSELTADGFEVGVHGLTHDGKLYDSREVFRKRASRINHYLQAWQAVGFRSPSMHCNLDWIHQDLKIDYDASTFDTDPFEPRGSGAKSIFPFVYPNDAGPNSFVELPYTLVQDFTLFVLLGEKSIRIWKQKLDWIVQNGGMALLNTHPDYMFFGQGKKRIDEYHAGFYTQFLSYIKDKFEGMYYTDLPSRAACFWRTRLSPSEDI